jgi:deoxyribonuclease V
MDIPALEILQSELASKLEIPVDSDGYQPREGDTLVSLDVQYKDDDAYVALEVRHWPDRVQNIYVCALRVNAPYLPGFFAFREGPVLKAALALLLEKTGVRPDCLLVDGHGTAHPRGFGVACWLGLETGMPVFGCAKEPLVRYEGELGQAAGSVLPVLVADRLVGHVLRPVDGIKPVFVSPGHRISLTTSTTMIRLLTGAYRICEPLRNADQACRAAAKGQVLAGNIVLEA